MNGLHLLQILEETPISEQELKILGLGYSSWEEHFRQIFRLKWHHACCRHSDPSYLGSQSKLDIEAAISRAKSFLNIR